jgi:integrase/recombinase XerC
MPTDPTTMSREHVESFNADLLTKYKPATASNRYRALQTFYRWPVKEREMAASPIDTMKPPAIRSRNSPARSGSSS